MARREAVYMDRERRGWFTKGCALVILLFALLVLLNERTRRAIFDQPWNREHPAAREPQPPAADQQDAPTGGPERPPPPRVGRVRDTREPTTDETRPGR